MTTKTRYFVISSLLVMFVGVGSGLVAYYTGFPAGAQSSHGGPEELQQVPDGVALIAYADVRHIMSSELRQRIRRAIPAQENGQQVLENQTGINIETDIDHVVVAVEPEAAGGSGGAPLVLARGTFNEVKIEALMREHGAKVEEYKGKRLIEASVGKPSDPNAASPENAPKHQDLTVAFLKPGLVALGSSTMVRRAIDLEHGGASVVNNDEIMTLVRSLDSGNAWAVGRFDTLRATANLPQGIGQLPAIKWFSATGTVNDGINGVVSAEADTDDAAKSLRDVVQGFVALATLGAGSKPELKTVVQSLELSGTGKTVALRFSVPGRILDLVTPAMLPKPENRQAH
jgi:hypothetical protein